METCVTPGRYFILRDLSTGFGSVEYLDPSKKEIRFRKKFNIPSSLLTGLPYGSTITQGGRGKTWTVCDRLNTQDLVANVRAKLGDDQVPVCENELISSADEEEDTLNHTESNINAGKKRKLDDLLRDDNQAQKLAHTDVLKLKEEGLSGSEIISTIVQGSDSFARRSDMAQEKYIARKMSRHVIQIGVMRCDSSNIATVYGPPVKIGGVRPHHIQMMLNEGDVRSGSEVLVFDHTSGFLTMNILGRLGGCGKCIFMSESKGVSDHIVKQANFTANQIENVKVDLPFDLMLRAVRESPNIDWVALPDGDRIDVVEKDADIPEEHKARAREVHVNLVRKYKIKRDTWQSLLENGVETVIYCVDPAKIEANNPTLLANLMSNLYLICEKFIRPGGRFCMFSSQMNPLGDLYGYMKARKNTWTAMRFEEAMIRKICVLPGRSHPQMESTLRLFEGFTMIASRMAGPPEKEPSL